MEAANGTTNHQAENETAIRLEGCGVVLAQAEKCLAMALEAALKALEAKSVQELVAATTELACWAQRRDELAEEFLSLTKQLRTEWAVSRG